MRAKEYLESVKAAEEDLRIICLKRDHYRELASTIPSPLSQPPGRTGTVSSRVETAAVNLADLVTQLDVKAAELTALITEAQALISRIPQKKFRDVLELRYLVGLSWKSISDEMHYQHEKSALRVHGYALLELQKLLTSDVLT